MAELLAAGMTGSVFSREFKPLKESEGAPHDMGQYCLLIDPFFGVLFYDRLAQVSDCVVLDEDARMPEQGELPA